MLLLVGQTTGTNLRKRLQMDIDENELENHDKNLESPIKTSMTYVEHINIVPGKPLSWDTEGAFDHMRWILRLARTGN
jgi:hypothetical protein